MAQGKIVWKETFKGLAARAAALALVGGVLYGLIAFSNSKRVHRNDDGTVTKQGYLAATSIVVGDCYQDQENAVEVSSVTAVPCDHPHTAQVYGFFSYPDPPLGRPSDEEMAATSGLNCGKVRTTAVDAGKTPNDPKWGSLSPDPTLWFTDHDILCTVTSTTPWTGSVLK